jgi:hypothetical protein
VVGEVRMPGAAPSASADTACSHDLRGSSLSRASAICRQLAGPPPDAGILRVGLRSDREDRHGDKAGRTWCSAAATRTCAGYSCAILVTSSTTASARVRSSSCQPRCIGNVVTPARLARPCRSGRGLGSPSRRTCPGRDAPPAVKVELPRQNDLDWGRRGRRHPGASGPGRSLGRRRRLPGRRAEGPTRRRRRVL